MGRPVEVQTPLQYFQTAVGGPNTLTTSLSGLPISFARSASSWQRLLYQVAYGPWIIESATHRHPPARREMAETTKYNRWRLINIRTPDSQSASIAMLTF